MGREVQVVNRQGTGHQRGLTGSSAQGEGGEMEYGNNIIMNISKDVSRFPVRFKLVSPDVTLFKHVFQVLLRNSASPVSWMSLGGLQ